MPQEAVEPVRLPELRRELPPRRGAVLCVPGQHAAESLVARDRLGADLPAMQVHLGPRQLHVKEHGLGVVPWKGLDADITTALLFVPLVKERIRTLREVLPLLDFYFQEQLAYDPGLLIQKKMDREGTLEALGRAESVLTSLESFGEEALEDALRAAAEDLGLKVGQFLGCIRVACTGKVVAPPLFGTLHLLGRETVIRRMRRAIELLRASS